MNIAVHLQTISTEAFTVFLMMELLTLVGIDNEYI